MIRLLYFSQATYLISNEHVQQILEASRRNNPAVGVTGILVHGGGLFMQVLEGPEQAVLRLYVKILDDNRHSNSEIIYITPTDKRIFENWSMGSINCSDALRFEQIKMLQSQRKEVVSTKVFTDVMHAFLKMLNADQLHKS
ncbi:MAG: BLUF domain-containing protein [Methylococcales bacterium]|nr:BLUF domain-containing protein [Methylococcales bacterium]